MTTLNPAQKHNVNIVGNLQAEHSLVFVHGFGSDQRAWQYVVPAFASDYRIVLLDNMGSGKSDRSAFLQSKYLNLRPYAEDLKAIIEYLQLDKVILIGHSMGAIISALAVNLLPQRITKLILIGANPRYLNDDGYYGGLIKEDIDNIYKQATAQFFTWTTHFSAAAMANSDRPELSEHFAESLRSYPQQSLLTVLCSILQTDYRADIQQINLPTLIMQSNHDLFVPHAVAEYLRDNIKGSQLRLIDASGHLPHFSAPAAVIAAIQAFLTSNCDH